MTAVELHRLDPARNMARFYRLDVQPSLFGWSVVSEWGRIGRPGAGQLRLSEPRPRPRKPMHSNATERSGRATPGREGRPLWAAPYSPPGGSRNPPGAVSALRVTVTDAADGRPVSRALL